MKGSRVVLCAVTALAIAALVAVIVYWQIRQQLANIAVFLVLLVFVAAVG